LDRKLLETRADADLRTLLEDWDAGGLGRENRITLVKRKTRRVPPTAEVDPGMTYYDIGLALSLVSDVKCRFVSTRLKLDFSPTNAALIRSMMPLEVRGEHPVEQETKIGLTLKFEVVKDVLGTEISPEVSRKRTVYYPEIVGSGEGTCVALWKLVAKGADEIRSNRDLRLLLSAPDGPPRANVQVRAEVAYEGFRGSIPLLGSGKDDYTGQVSFD
jgi:hypothetical protein